MTEKCKFHNTSDPRVFGKYIWKTLHIIAHNYPKSPSDKEIKHCKRFVTSFPYMLPCEHCGCDLLNFNKEYFNKRSLNKVCSTQKGLV